MKKIFLVLLFPTLLFAYSRIISLAPSITETLFFVGAGKQVVGVSRFCQYPKEAQKKTKIGGYLDLNYEKILQLKPDLVLSLDTDKTVQKKIKKLNIPVSAVTQTSLEEIKTSILTIGKLTGHVKEAKHKLKEIEKNIKQKPLSSQNSVLLIVGRSIGNLNQIYVAGNKGFYNEIISLSGATNAFSAKMKIPYPVINMESLISLDPDIIIELIDNRGTKKIIKQKLKDWNAFPSLRAVKNNHIYYIQKDYSTIPGPRIFKLVNDIHNILKKSSAH